MAHFAKVEDGIVVDVMVVDNENCNDLDFPQSESVGKKYISDLGIKGEWVQTSYNKNFRGQFAGKGMIWDGLIFHEKGPFASWILNKAGEWKPPSECPGDGYQWDEDSVSWVNPPQ